MSNELKNVSRRAVVGGVGAVTFIAAHNAEAQTKAAPVARTRQGRVRGFTRNGAQIFLGIPYGASTAGARRFLPPAPPASWSGVRDGTKLGDRAPQTGPPLYLDPYQGDWMSGGRVKELIALNEKMGENCLVVNVVTPAADKKGRPVLVYLHGGGYRQGSGATHTLGDRLVTEEDVVLVTVNHRLSVLGFLYLGGISPKYAEGNPGFLDLVAALKWVRDNIENFGGDPAKVTIFGESGGAGKVGALMAMPQAKGLFRAAIMESGTPPNPITPERATADAKTILAKFGVTPNNLSAALAIPFDKFIPENAGPVADGRTLQANLWGPNAPETAANVPLIYGYTRDEATLFHGLSDPSQFSLDWPGVEKKLSAIFNKPESQITPSITAYRAAYPAENASDIFFRILSFASMGRNFQRYAAMKVRQAPPVYAYCMEYDSKIAPGLRAFHTVELALSVRLVLQPQAENLSKQIAGAWAAFARTGGDPNHAGLPHWAPYRPGVGPTMLFGLTSHSVTDPEQAAQAEVSRLLGDQTIGIGPVRPS